MKYSWMLALALIGPPSVGADHAPMSVDSAGSSTSIAKRADRVASEIPIPVPSDLAVRHYRSGNVLWWTATLWGLAVPAIIFFSGISARMRNLALLVNRRWYISLAVYLALLGSLWALADLPLDFYTQYVRPHEYGLSSQDIHKWFKDYVLSLALGILGAMLVLWIPLLVMRRSPRRWWLYAWLAALPVLIFLTLIEPIWVEPLFNHFGPMQDKSLETRIIGLASRAGVDAAAVYQVDKSVDTNELNAYVAGIGSTKRIVLWDTTLHELSPEQVEQVMAHEMGHYVLLHVWKGLLGASLALLAGFWFVHASAGWILKRSNRVSQVHELADFASLPLLALTLSACAFVLTPSMLAVSRHFEHEADRFGLELTHDNQACATAFVKFVQHDLDYPTPSPVVQFFQASHPSLAQRINFCNSYHPWREGNEGRYSRYIK